jgi:hypothetical protein
VVKGVQREIPLVGVWGYPPRFKKSPKTGGYRGLIKAITVNFYRMENLRQSQLTNNPMAIVYYSIAQNYRLMCN